MTFFCFQLNQILFWFADPFYFLICWLFWKTWPTKLIYLADKDKLEIVLSFIPIYLLRHKYYEVTVEGKDGKQETCFPHFIKLSW